MKYSKYKLRHCVFHAATLFAACSIALQAQANGPSGYLSVQTVSQGGDFPVNGLAGDAFGQVVGFNKDFLFVASPGSQPGGKSISGAVFVYRKGLSGYERTQVITTGGTGDHLGMLQILSQGDWLILGVNGTPVGPQPNDSVADQDFRGAVLIYRLNQLNGQWDLKQTLDSSSPGLADLAVIENGGIPVLETEQGANFGLRMAMDVERGWLFVAALYQKGLNSLNQPVMNAGKVFAFQLDPVTSLWQLAESFTSPDGVAENDAFGAAVAVEGRFAMISNGPVFQGPHIGNSSVSVYTLDQGKWTFLQRLTGTQQTLTPLFFPQFSSEVLNLGDSFGNAIALSENDAVITAPLETAEGGAAYRGAAYFFRRKNAGGNERWVLTQRVESDDPNSLAFGAFSVALSENLAVISDLGRTGASGPFQGAAHVYQRRADAWEKVATLTDPSGTPSAGFGAGVAIGPEKQLAIGSSPFLGFFVPVIFRPPPAAGPPVLPGKAIIYEPSSD
jgi:hypothetical protein